jgi:hypothetical protein
MKKASNRLEEEDPSEAVQNLEDPIVFFLVFTNIFYGFFCKTLVLIQKKLMICGGFDVKCNHRMVNICSF